MHWLALSSIKLKNFEFGPESKFESLAVFWIKTFHNQILENLRAYRNLKLLKTTFSAPWSKLGDWLDQPIHGPNANKKFPMCNNIQANAVHRPGLFFWWGLDPAKITAQWHSFHPVSTFRRPRLTRGYWRSKMLFRVQTDQNHRIFPKHFLRHHQILVWHNRRPTIRLRRILKITWAKYFDCGPSKRKSSEKNKSSKRPARAVISNETRRQIHVCYRR